MTPLSPNNRMQRSGNDKVHAPFRRHVFAGGSYALQAQRAVADAGRWAALTLSVALTKNRQTWLLA
jgi:hypothetical protein